MSDMKTKRAISNDVVDLLERYPNNHQDVVSLLLSFVGEGSVVHSTKQKSAPIAGSKTKKSTSKQGRASGPTPPGGTVNSSSSAPIEGNQEDCGLLDISDLNVCKTVPIMMCVLDPLSQAQRQAGAMKPRMDKKSIQVRVKGARKALRKVLNSYDNGGEEMTGFFTSTSFFIVLINAVKHLRIVLRDATTAGIREVNLGVDLVENWISLRIFQDLAARVQKEGKFVLDENTHFWTDPKGMGQKALSQGAESDVANPFA